MNSAHPIGDRKEGAPGKGTSIVTHASPRRLTRLDPDDQRGHRVLAALSVRPRSRAELDSIAGAANSPNLVLRLRREYGLNLPCHHVRLIDRDGRPCRPGVYSVSTADVPKIRRLLRPEPRQQPRGDQLSLV
jgi:hypothetical protein